MKKEKSPLLGRGLRGGLEKKFAEVMDYPDKMKVFDFSDGYDPKYIRSFEWGIGQYDEKRQNMYVNPQYKGSSESSAGRRNIHMGIDIWTTANSPVFAFDDGIIAYFNDNDQPGDYGPTIITQHTLGHQTIFALYGHLSRSSLEEIEVGETVKKGEKIAEIGEKRVNGGWAPHLHFQLSIKDPGKADMPGVVAEEDHEEALKIYPDPRIILGEIY